MYSFDSRVRYSEVGPDKHLDLAAIINYFQDCSTFQSEDIGKGLDYLKNVNHVWLLYSWQIQVERYPGLGETITTGTWPYGFKNMYGYRNFIIKDESGSVCAAANSIWVLLDTGTNRPVKISDADMNGYCIEEKYDMNYAKRKIMIPDHLDPLTAFTVTKSNIDTNNHVNNGQYIKMAEEYLPADFKINKMKAEYRLSALLGDTVIPKVKISNAICTIVLTNTEDMPYAVIEFESAAK